MREPARTTAPPSVWRDAPARRWVVAYVLVAVALAAALPALRPRLGELQVYTEAAERMVHGEEIYRPSDAKPFTYPPFFALPFIPLVPLPEPLQRGAWYLVNLLLLGAVVVLLLRRVRPALGPPGRWPGLPVPLFLLVVGVLSARYLISPLEYQGHDLLLFLLVLIGIDAWAAGATWRAGIWIGLGAASKATPLLFLPVFLWQRRFRIALAMLVAAAGASLLPDLLVRRPDGALWVAGWYRTFVSEIEVGGPAAGAGAWQAWNLLNQSLSGTAYRLLTPVAQGAHRFDVSVRDPGPAGVRVAILLAQILVAGLLAFATRRRDERSWPEAEIAFRRLGEGAAVLLAMLLLSPISSKQHFVTLVVPLAYCAADFFYRRRSLLVGGLLLFVFLVGTLTAKDLIGRSFGDRLLAYGSLTFCTMALLVATVCVLEDRARHFSAQAVRERLAAAPVAVQRET